MKRRSGLDSKRFNVNHVHMDSQSVGISRLMVKSVDTDCNRKYVLQRMDTNTAVRRIIIDTLPYQLQSAPDSQT